jgi:hypothetical protein
VCWKSRRRPSLADSGRGLGLDWKRGLSVSGPRRNLLVRGMFSDYDSKSRRDSSQSAVRELTQVAILSKREGRE